MRGRYKTGDVWTPVKDVAVPTYRGPVAGFVVLETALLIDTQTGTEYEAGTHRVRIPWVANGVEKPRTKAFEGETAWNSGQRYFEEVTGQLSRATVDWPVSAAPSKRAQNRGIATKAGQHLTLVTIRGEKGAWVVRDPTTIPYSPPWSLEGEGGNKQRPSYVARMTFFEAQQLHKGDTLNEATRVFSLGEVTTVTRRRSTCEPQTSQEMREVELGYTGSGRPEFPLVSSPVPSIGPSPTPEPSLEPTPEPSPKAVEKAPERVAVPVSAKDSDQLSFF